MSYRRRSRRYNKGGGVNYARFKNYIEPMVGAQGTDASKQYWGATLPYAKAQYINGLNPALLMRRRAFGMYGPGDYKSWFNSWLPRGSFETGGRFLGAATGIPGLDNLGAWAGNKASNYLGIGDYVSGNQITGGAGSQQTIAVNPGDMSGDIVVARTEFLQNITATIGGSGQSAFSQIVFPINPGLAQTFPFLSQIAQNYTLYEFYGVIFQYKPISGENNNVNNGLGKVVMATQYDPDAPQFINSQQMENYDYANATKPSCGAIHGVETKNSQQFGNMQYIRTGATTRDKVFTDIGDFYIATEGVPGTPASTVTLGELWVTYRVRLSRAQLYGTSLGNNILQDQIFSTGDVNGYASVPLYKGTNTLGCTISNASSTSYLITFPANIVQGTFLLMFRCSKATSNATVITGASTFVNCSGYRMVNNVAAGTTTAMESNPTFDNSTNNTRFGAYIICNVTAPGNNVATITIPFSLAPSGIMAAQLLITQVAYNPWVN